MNRAVLAPYGIGNLILVYPLLKLMHSRGVEFDIICYLSSVDRILGTLEPFRGVYREKFFVGGGIGRIAQTLRTIRSRHYDVSVLSFPSARAHYHALHFLCGAKQRVAARYPDEGPGSLSFLSTELVDVEVGIRDVHQNLRLYRFLDPGLTDEAVRPYPLRENNTSNRIGFHVGCKRSEQFRRWPLRHWRRLIDMIHEHSPGREMVMFFGPDEREELRLFREIPHVTVREGLPVEKLFSEIANCRLFLSNDSGLMHIAAFTGVRGISIWGPSDYRRTGPFSDEAIVLHGECPEWPCSHSYYRSTHRGKCKRGHACLEQLEPEEVFETARPYL